MENSPSINGETFKLKIKEDYFSPPLLKKQRIPRKLKKKRKKGWVMQYDLASLPNGVSWDDLMDMMKKSGTIVFNSAIGSEPQIIQLGGNKNKHLKKIKFIDVNNK